MLLAVLLFTLLSSLLSTSHVNAAPGNLDTSFGTGGLALSAVPSGTYTDAAAVAIQSDGKILTAGTYYNGAAYVLGLVRFNPNGILDPTFGQFGLASVPGSSGVSYSATGVAVQSDGKIVEVGYVYRTTPTGYDYSIARFNTDGSLDSGFGPNSNGTTTVDFFGSTDIARSVIIQGDGKIVVFGYAYNGGQDVFAAARLTSLGTMDTSFGTGGKVTTLIGSGSAFLFAATIQSDGKLVAAGRSIVSGINHFTIVRYNADGSVDTGFGSSGIATSAVSTAFDEAFAVTQQPDGKIVAVGLAQVASAEVYGIARYNTDGTPDTSFGSGGKLTTALGTIADVAWSVVVQGNGKIIVSGYSYTGTNYAIGLVRYNSDGSFDSLFGNGGKVIQTLGTNSFVTRAMALQQDGKILTVAALNSQAAVVRFQGDPQIDNVSPTWTSGSNLNATLLGSTSVFLTWTPATDNIGVTGYRVYQGSTLIATLPSTSSSYLVTGLTEGSSYNFKVQAGDAANNWSTNGPSASATLPAPPSFLTANLPWLILLAVVIGFGVAMVLTKPKAPKMG